jgi:hypothetical protein
VSHEIEVFTFSEFHSIRLTKQFVDITEKAYKIYCAAKSMTVLRSMFLNVVVSGRTLAEYITNNTPYFLNFRPELKKLMKDYVHHKINNQFDEMDFLFKEINYNQSSTEEIEAENGLRLSPQNKKPENKTPSKVKSPLKAQTSSGTPSIKKFFSPTSAKTSSSSDNRNVEPNDHHKSPEVSALNFDNQAVASSSTNRNIIHNDIDESLQTQLSKSEGLKVVENRPIRKRKRTKDTGNKSKVKK